MLHTGRSFAAKVARLFRPTWILAPLLLVKYDLLFPAFVTPLKRASDFSESLTWRQLRAFGTLFAAWKTVQNAMGLAEPVLRNADSESLGDVEGEGDLNQVRPP